MCSRRGDRRGVPLESDRGSTRTVFSDPAEHRFRLLDGKPKLDLDAAIHAPLIHMRSTLNIDDNLLKEASRLSGIVEKTALVRAGLEALIALSASRRLAELGGAEPRILRAPRGRARRN